MMEITKLTPFFEKSNICIFNGDVLKKNTFNYEFFDLGITSPPYNIGIEYGSNNDELHYNEYLKFSKIWLKNCYFIGEIILDNLCYLIFLKNLVALLFSLLYLKGYTNNVNHLHGNYS